MPIYSYRCPCGTSFDELVPLAERAEQPCESCGTAAPQRITPVRIDYLAMGVDPDFETAGRKWEQSHAQQKAKEEKSVSNHGEGEYGPSPGA